MLTPQPPPSAPFPFLRTVELFERSLNVRYTTAEALRAIPFKSPSTGPDREIKNVRREGGFEQKTVSENR